MCVHKYSTTSIKFPKYFKISACRAVLRGGDSVRITTPVLLAEKLNHREVGWMPWESLTQPKRHPRSPSPSVEKCLAAKSVQTKLESRRYWGFSDSLMGLQGEKHASGAEPPRLLVTVTVHQPLLACCRHGGASLTMPISNFPFPDVAGAAVATGGGKGAL